MSISRFYRSALWRFFALAVLSFSLIGIFPKLARSSVVAPQSSEAIVAQYYIEDEMAYLKRSRQSWLEIDLTRQRLIAWEGRSQVYAAIVSTGKDETPTPTGIFSIYIKLPEAQMEGEDYYISDVPYVMYYDGSYGIHGAYWHNNFGIPVSHGCTNVAVDHAEWFYNWARVGTPVVVHY
ncbi:MAG: L,D-transpeptidase [Geitlerinemataceae cyanobacterium]